METAKNLEQCEEWRKRAFLGPLPPSFLRIENTWSGNQQEEADRQAAFALQQMQNQTMSLMGRLTITVVQAKLIKNYGFTNMDPYVRLRVGHTIYETHTDRKGGKNPHWNKVIQVFLPPGVNKIYVEIYDECSFTMDELIAWGHIDIPSQVIEKGTTYEDWYLLSGKQGDNLEGSINLVLSYHARNPKAYMEMRPPVVMVPSTNMVGSIQPFAPVNVYTAPPVNPVPPVPASSLPNAEVELKQISEMFPNIDKEVIKSVYDANNGKKDTTINSLLQMVE
ncbi:toll-interacting protein-like [Nasonia vitripennis]|uniref:Toll-interacting protein n=1 Tax=Nasonia vitripennis TaxID=7425 RepID=A0A7M7H7Z1_NASVI|nr:toll-interacting protein-like [Nasonia vitripennis]XP_008213197.1 toll-interacting protein-like [Nasonia vitripennis]XP_016844513.1 toll-interacting protein-like [Nasonia vitripennis]